jgi:tocopherol O-methyltransferase
MHFGYWDETTRNNWQATRRFNEILADKAGITASDHVLDAGCGIGGSSVFLAKRYGCKVTGITITPRQIPLATAFAEREGVGDRCRFVEMDYQATAFPDEHFTVFWGLESLCYAQSKKQLIGEAYRVLRPRGRMIAADGFASKETYEGKEAKLMQRWLDGWIVNSVETGEAWKRHALEVGFAAADYWDVSRNVMPTSRIMYALSMLFLPLHLLDRFIRIKQYPTDALHYQYGAMKKGLWQYGIFLASK